MEKAPFILDTGEFWQCVTHGAYTEHWQETAYVLFTFVVIFAAPLLVILTCYALIFLRLNRKARTMLSSSRLIFSPNNWKDLIDYPWKNTSNAFQRNALSEERVPAVRPVVAASTPWDAPNGRPYGCRYSSSQRSFFAGVKQCHKSIFPIVNWRDWNMFWGFEMMFCFCSSALSHSDDLRSLCPSAIRWHRRHTRGTAYLLFR